MYSKFLPLLRRILGESYHTRDGNHSFHCPKCNHHKKKLEIDPDKGLWHCWVCEDGGKSLKSLFKWLDVEQSKFDELRQLLGSEYSDRKFKKKEEKSTKTVKLPEEFKPLWIPNEKSFFWRSAYNYLMGRGILPNDILKYGLGYCVDGRYSDMIIIPSYADDHSLNYVTYRGYLPNKTFMNPPYSRNVIGFDSTINWKEPIILTEAPLDAITIRRNAIPLFGKGISKALKLKIAIENVSDIIMCLDGDAIINSINHISYFVENGINVKMVELDEQLEEDPNKLGYHAIWDRINNAIPADRDWLYNTRIKEHLHGKGKTYLPYKRRSYTSFSKAQGVSGSIR